MLISGRDGEQSRIHGLPIPGSDLALVELEDVSMASVIFESDAVATVINTLLSPRAFAI